MASAAVNECKCECVGLSCAYTYTGPWWSGWAWAQADVGMDEVPWAEGPAIAGCVGGPAVDRGFS